MKSLEGSALIKQALGDLINVIDLTLDENGFEDTPDIQEALGRLEAAILEDAIPDYLVEDNDEEELLGDEPLEEEDLEDDD